MSLLQDPEKYRTKIGNKPDEPNCYAEFMERQNESFILAEQYDRRPDGVDEHEDDRQQARQAVYIIDEPTGGFEHQPRPPGIANDAEPKEDQVPEFESSGESFAPDSDGIEHQSKIDDNEGSSDCHCCLSARVDEFV